MNMRVGGIDEPLLTEIQAAAYLNQKVKTLQARRVSGGGAPFVKLGRAVRYRMSDLREFVAASVRSSTMDRENA